MNYEPIEATRMTTTTKQQKHTVPHEKKIRVANKNKNCKKTTPSNKYTISITACFLKELKKMYTYIYIHIKTYIYTSSAASVISFLSLENAV